MDIGDGAAAVYSFMTGHAWVTLGPVLISCPNVGGFPKIRGTLLRVHKTRTT